MSLLYFVTESYLKEQTGISGNVDPQDIMPHVQVAAELYIARLLGREYFDYLVGVYNAGTATSAEELLIQHIRPAVAWRSFEMAIPFAAFEWKNKGIQTQTGEYSANADMAGINYIREEAMNRAEYYATRLTRFLKLNEEDYPGWTAESNKEDTPPDKKDSYEDGGVFFI